MNPIKLFGINDCNRTLTYKTWLQQHQIPFYYYDIGENEENQYLLSQYYKSGSLYFPTLVVDNQKFKRPNLERLMEVIIKKSIDALPNIRSIVTSDGKDYLLVKKRKREEVIVKRLLDQVLPFPSIKYNDGSFAKFSLGTKEKILAFFTNHQIKA